MIRILNLHRHSKKRDYFEMRKVDMKRGFVFQVILAGAVFVCGFSGSTGSTGSTVDARATLSKAMNAMLAARSYRARLESSTSNGTRTTTLVEFVSPDHFHLTRDVSVAGRAPRRHETIIIAGDTWMKMGDTPWQKFPVNLSDLITQFRDPKIVDEIARSVDVELIGAEVLDGSQTAVYTYTLKDPDDKQSDITAKTWVGVADSLPRKTESESDADIGGKQIHIKGVVTYYDYQADIRIEKPF